MCIYAHAYLYTYAYVYMYQCVCSVCVCVCMPEGGCRRLARVGSAILQRKPLAPGQGRVSPRIGIRCPTPGYPARVFSALGAFISSSFIPVLSLSLCWPRDPPPLPQHQRLFTCITEDTRGTSTRLRAFKVTSQKPRAIRIDPAGSGTRF